MERRSEIELELAEKVKVLVREYEEKMKPIYIAEILVGLASGFYACQLHDCGQLRYAEGDLFEIVRDYVNSVKDHVDKVGTYETK